MLAALLATYTAFITGQVAQHAPVIRIQLPIASVVQYVESHGYNCVHVSSKLPSVSHQLICTIQPR